jgi:hypothetical protein
MAFSNINNPGIFPPPGSGPYLISRDWCIGDSLLYINNNNSIFDTRTLDLSAKFPIATIDIQDKAITKAKLVESVGLSVIGRSDGSQGIPSDIIAGTNGHVLRRSGNNLNFGQVGGPGIADNAIIESKIANNQVTNAKLRQSTGLSVIGRSASSLGSPADIVAATDGHVLRRSGNSLGFGLITTANIADNTVTTNKLANNAVINAKVASNAAIAGTKVTPNFGNQHIITGTNLSIGNTSNTNGGFYIRDRIVQYRGPNSTQPGPQLTLDGYPGPNQAVKNMNAVIQTTGVDSGGLLIVVGDNNGDESAIDVWNRGTPSTPGSPRTVNQGLQFRVRSNGLVQARGNILANRSTITSDRNLKTEIKDTEIDSINFLNKFRVVDYKWKDAEEHNRDSYEHTGLIAQEVEEHLPGAVINEEGTYYLDYSSFIGPLIKFAQDLSKTVLKQEEIIENLKNKEIEELKARIAILEAKTV